MNRNIQRFPRGLGMTELASQANMGDNEALTNLTNFVIRVWIVNNGKLWGKIYSAMELAEFLKCEPVIIQTKMREIVLDSRLFNREQADKVMESLIGAAVGWAIEDRMEISHQVDVLKAFQGDKYVPFVTSEVNKAISLKQASTNSIQSLIRTLSGGGSVNIFNQQNNQYNMQPGSIGVTREEAVKMIQTEVESKGGLKELAYVEDTYDFNELPQVVATKQDERRSDKEGLTLKNHEIDAIVSDYNGASKAFDEDHHALRREIEEGMDIYAEDPEMNLP